jgi:hypothetical protein
MRPTAASRDPDDAQSRYIEATTGGVRVGCLYLPNGNPAPGPKFDYKFRWVDCLAARAAELVVRREPVMLSGDYNVIPEDLDIYHPESWVDDAFFQSEAGEAYRRLLAQGWTDVVPRTTVPPLQVVGAGDETSGDGRPVVVPGPSPARDRVPQPAQLRAAAARFCLDLGGETERDVGLRGERVELGPGRRLALAAVYLLHPLPQHRREQLPVGRGLHDPRDIPWRNRGNRLAAQPGPGSHRRCRTTEIGERLPG